MTLKVGRKYTLTFDITPNQPVAASAFGIATGTYTLDTMRSTYATNLLYNHASVGTLDIALTSGTKKTFAYDFYVYGIKNGGAQVAQVGTTTMGGANAMFINLLKTAGITSFNATIDNFKIVETYITD